MGQALSDKIKDELGRVEEQEKECIERLRTLGVKRETLRGLLGQAADKPKRDMGIRRGEIEQGSTFHRAMDVLRKEGASMHVKDILEAINKNGQPVKISNLTAMLYTKAKNGLYVKLIKPGVFQLK